MHPALGRLIAMKVIVYTSPTCTYCYVVKIFLKKNKIKFEEIDISEDNESGKMLMEKTGVETVPVTFVGEKFVVGYDKKKLKELLEL